MYVFPPDTISYRHQTCGSFLIQYVVEEFNAHAHEDDIEELFRKVSFTIANSFLSVKPPHISNVS